jgi:hypothetical protein
MRLTSVPAVGVAAQRVVDARVRLSLCPPSAPLWRHLSVQAEAAWQALWETVGRNNAAALAALREVQGVA